jgi:phospholipid/cholesterol/gamma-HCH transport system ATP-binding protein
MLHVENLHIRFGNSDILKDVNIDVEEGSILSILGGSGCGKSTMLRAVMRLIPIAGGTISIDGREINNLSEREMNEVRKTMGMVFQEGALFDSMNVFENVAFPLRRHTRKKEDEIRRIVHERLEAVDMEGSEEKLPSQLSGGMRRRVGIARALALSPRLLLYDEPTTGLDPILTRTVVDLILKTRARYGTTGVVVTHDMEAAQRFSDAVAIIHEGRVIAQGDYETVRCSKDPYVRNFLDAMKRTSDEAS